MALEQVLAQARTFLDRKQFDDCAAQLAEAVRFERRNAKPDRRRLALLAELAQKRGQPEEGLAACAELRRHYGLQGLEWQIESGLLLEIGRPCDALARLDEMEKEPKQRITALVARARLFEKLDDWPRVVACWEQALAAAPCPSAPLFYGRGLAYLAIGEVAEALADFTALAARWPGNHRGPQGLCAAYIANRAFPAARAVLDAAHRQFDALPHWLVECEARYANETAEEAGLVDFCRRFLTGTNVTDAYVMRAMRILLRSRGYRLTLATQREMRAVFTDPQRRARVEEAMRDSAVVWESEHQTLARMRQRLAALSPPRRLGPTGLDYRTKLAMALVQTGQPAAARAEAEAIARDVAAWPAVPAQTSALLEWLAVQRGDVAAAKARYVARRRMFARGDRLCELVPIRQAAGGADVVVFAQIRNEATGMPHFLKHYRKLGVQHFVIVDNGSTDETVALLAGEPDVELYQTFSAFRRAAAGNDWICPLMVERRFAEALCVRVDADELMVYPHSETRPLPALWAYLRARGMEAMGGPMLDMYPQRLRDIARGDYVMASRYLDRELTMRPGIVAPYREYFGGVRTRFLDGQRQLLGKVPAIRGGGAVLLDRNSSHYASPAVMADVSCALLHYKFRPGFIEKAKIEVQRKEYGGAAQSFAGLITAENRLDESLISPLSVEYKSTLQLVELGLLQTSPEWDAFRA